MSEPFIGEVRMFAGTFAPRFWAFCNGQLIQIADNTALFSLLGTAYGGDGRVNFALPDLGARAPMGTGTGTGLTPRRPGMRGGSTTAPLTISTVPAHTHPFNTNCLDADGNSPEQKVLGMSSGRGGAQIYAAADGAAVMDIAALSNTGGSAAHENMQPSLAVNFIIALEGLYPSRS